MTAGPGGSPHVLVRRRAGRGRRHELFPSIGAGNPALTAMADALRVDDQLLARLA